MICSKCGHTEEGEQNFCRKCGSLLDTDISTVPLTECMDQPPMDTTDILIVLKDELRKTSREHRAGAFVITFADVDREHKLPAGSTELHIEQAAQESDMDIKKGATRAELRRRPLKPMRVRGFGEGRW
jgi:hypothetical protein